MSNGVLVILLAIISVPLIGAGNDGHAQTGVVSHLSDRSNPNDTSRVVDREINERVKDILRAADEEGVIEHSSHEPPESESVE